MAFQYGYDAQGNFRLINSRTGKIYQQFSDKGGVGTLADFVTLKDDFLGDLLEDGWSGNSGADAQAVDPAINAQIGGVARLVSGNVGDGATNDACSLTHSLGWQASNGGLVFETRVKVVGATADAIVFVGFTDVLAAGTLEYPFTLSGTTLTSNAGDAVGLLFDTAATNDLWHMVGVAGNTDAFDSGDSNTGVAPTADVYQTIRIEIDSAGQAEFFIDGASVGVLAAAVTAATDISPVICVGANTTTSITVDVDYVEINMQR